MSAAVVLAVIVAACGCQPNSVAVPSKGTSGVIMHTYTGTGPRVVVLGDSLTVGTWDRLYRDLGQDHAVKIAARFGEGFDGGSFSDAFGRPVMVDAAAEYAADQPAVAVIALGTNTAWHNSARADDIDLALANEATAVAGFGAACLVRVTLPTASTAPGWDPAVAERLNASSAAWTDRTVDWAGTVAARPELLDAGGVHATPEGYRVRAKMIAAAVRSC